MFGNPENENPFEATAIGELYERNGAGLFLMVEKEKDGRGMREQLLARLAAPHRQG